MLIFDVQFFFQDIIYALSHRQFSEQFLRKNVNKVVIFWVWGTCLLHLFVTLFIQPQLQKDGRCEW